MFSSWQQEENINYVKGRMSSLILLWARFFNMHLCENYHIVPLKLIRYHHKSLGVNLRDKKKGSKCTFVVSKEASLSWRETCSPYSSSVLPGWALPGDLWKIPGRLSRRCSSQSTSFPSNREALIGSVIPILVFISTCGGVDEWEAGVEFGSGGNEP